MNQCKYILDTNVIVDLLREGNKNIAKRISEVGISSCCISDITLYELYVGAIYSNNPETEKNRITNICSMLGGILPVSNHITACLKQKEYLKKQGIMIPDFDIMIATSGIENNLTVISSDKHIKHLEGICLENWR